MDVDTGLRVVLPEINEHRRCLLVVAAAHALVHINLLSDASSVMRWGGRIAHGIDEDGLPQPIGRVGQ
jgi:hypothetical protein